MSSGNDEVDGWIAQLMQCKPLSEAEVKKLCDKVGSTDGPEMVLQSHLVLRTVPYGGLAGMAGMRDAKKNTRSGSDDCAGMFDMMRQPRARVIGERGPQDVMGSARAELALACYRTSFNPSFMLFASDSACCQAQNTCLGYAMALWSLRLHIFDCR